MSSSKELIELIKPVLLKVCEYYTFKKNGVEVKHEQVQSELNTMFLQIKKKVDLDDGLNKLYAQVEKPLVFFSDYIIKESGFTFSREYVPLARHYNVLSGDDKFFDILDIALEDNSVDKSVIEVFYILMGLGFDGAYKREPKEVIKRIYDCQHRCDTVVNPQNEILFPDLQPKSDLNSKKSGRFDFFRNNVLYTLIVVLVICMIMNLLSISVNIGDFTDTVNKAMVDASPYNNMTKRNHEEINTDTIDGDSVDIDEDLVNE